MELVPRSVLPALFIAGLLYQNHVNAQGAPDWESAVGTVSWMRTTSAGNLLVCTNDGLKGLDPSTGSIQWTIKELANAPEANYEEVKGTPFVALAPASSTDQLFIVEPFEGHVLFSSAAAGIEKVASKYFLYEANEIILVGQQNGKEPVMACIDMNTGKTLWTKSSDFSKLTACVAANPDEILLTTLFFAYKLNAHTGAEIWKQSPDPKFASMAGFMTMLDKGGANLNMGNDIGAVLVTTPNAPDLAFMGAQKMNKKQVTDSQGKTTETVTYESFFNAFRIKDGSYAWSHPLNLGQKLGAVIPVKDGLVIGGGDNNYANLLDYQTGEGKWGKNGRGNTVKGSLQNAIPIGDRMLLVSGDKDAAAMLVDASGNDLWKKNVKLDGAMEKVVELPNAIALGSAEEVDVVDRNTGATLIDGPFKGGSGLIAIEGDNVYLFNVKDGLLRAMDRSGTGARTLGSVPLKFEGKDAPKLLEVVPGGVLVSADQNMALVGTDGATKYHKYFPAPRESGLTRALYYASAVRAAYYTAAFGYTSAAFGAVSSRIQVQDAGSSAAKEITGQLSNIYGDAAKMGLSATKRFLDAAKARFTATTRTQAVQYVLSEVASREFALLAVNKADGTVMNTVALGRDKTPQYTVDGADNSLYLMGDGKVKAFRGK